MLTEILIQEAGQVIDYDFKTANQERGEIKSYWGFKFVEIGKFPEVEAITEKLGLGRQYGRSNGEMVGRKWRNRPVTKVNWWEDT